MWLLLILLIATPALAWAGDQDAQAPDRTTLLAAEREKKATATAPPERSAVERALHWYDSQYLIAKIREGWHGLHLAGGGFPAGAGTAIGVGFTRGTRVQIETSAAYSTRGYARAGAALNVSNVAGAPLDLRVRAQSSEFPQEDFFGLGRGSRQEDRTDYLFESREVGADVRWTPSKRIGLSGGLSYVTPRIGAGTDRRFASTEEIFNAAAIPGFLEQPDFLRADAAAAFDWRDNPRHPRAGGRYGVRFSDFRDRNRSALSFQRIELDVQQHVPLPDRYRTLALGAAATFTDAAAGRAVPFFYQPTLGGSHTLRGFREFRFRDRNSVALTAEYRWEAWWALDGAFFVDAGTVAPERRALRLRDVDVSYGVGFRFHSNSAFVARLDLAFSREGFIPLLRFDHVF